MTILEMIAEWRKGRSNAALEHPEQCQERTLALIDAIERKEQKDAEVSGDVYVIVESDGEMRPSYYLRAWAESAQAAESEIARLIEQRIKYAKERREDGAVPQWEIDLLKSLYKIVRTRKIEQH